MNLLRPYLRSTAPMYPPLKVMHRQQMNYEKTEHSLFLH